MCVFIKNNIKCVALILLLLEICIQNWYFWVYMPSDIVIVMKRDEPFPILTSNCTESLDTCRSVDYSKLILRKDNEIKTNLCHKKFVYNMCCNHITANKYAFYNNNLCSYMRITNESFVQLNIIYGVESEGEKIDNEIGCTLKHDTSTSTSNSDVYIKFHCKEKVNSDSTKSIFCDINCGIQYLNIIKQRTRFNYLTKIVAILLKVITILVFLVVPRLQAGYGKSLMSYVFARILREVATLCIIAVFNDDKEGQEYIFTNVLKYYTDLVAHVWQIIITFQIWAAFRFSRPTSRSTVSKTKFITISAYVWGVPFILAASYLAVHMSMLNDPGAQMIAGTVEIALLMVLELIAMTLAAATLVNLRASRASRRQLERADSGQHNALNVQWDSLYVKIILLAGVDYVFVMFVYLASRVAILTETYYVPTFIYNIMLDIYFIRGVEVFFIFVLKRDVWIQLKTLVHK